MKIVVNSGRTVHVLAKTPVKTGDGTYARPVLKAHGPTNLIDLPNEDAEFLIGRGYATKYDAPAPVEDPKLSK